MSMRSKLWCRSACVNRMIVLPTILLVQVQQSSALCVRMYVRINNIETKKPFMYAFVMLVHLGTI